MVPGEEADGLFSIRALVDFPERWNAHAAKQRAHFGAIIHDEQFGRRAAGWVFHAEILHTVTLADYRRS